MGVVMRKIALFMGEFGEYQIELSGAIIQEAKKADAAIQIFTNSGSYGSNLFHALGEKTIERDSISINRDRQYFRTGHSVSDQVMARALMTPDELRRLDNDMCIVFFFFINIRIVWIIFSPLSSFYFPYIIVAYFYSCHFSCHWMFKVVEFIRFYWF